MKRSIHSSVAKGLAFVLIVFSSLAYADSSNFLTYREKMMGAIGSHMKALSLIAKEGKETPLLKHAAKHGQALKELAEISYDIFPVETKSLKSHAKPGIWDKQGLSKEFKEELDKFKEAADKVAALTKNNDYTGVVKSLKTIGGSCKSCHNSFKSK